MATINLDVFQNKSMYIVKVANSKNQVVVKKFVQKQNCNRAQRLIISFFKVQRGFRRNKISFFLPGREFTPILTKIKIKYNEDQKFFSINLSCIFCISGMAINLVAGTGAICRLNIPLHEFVLVSGWRIVGKRSAGFL